MQVQEDKCYLEEEACANFLQICNREKKKWNQFDLNQHDCRLS